MSYGFDQKARVLEIIEENHYYPYGLKHTRYNTGEKKYQPDEQNPELMKLQPIPAGEQSLYKYKYNGQEWQDELGLNVTAMDFRQYDNAIGRFHSIDALAELSYSTSPFVFSYNSPVFWSDPSGLVSASFFNSFLDNTGSGKKKTWVNNGQGNFDNTDGSGFITEDGKYFEYSQSLSEVVVKTSKGYRNDQSILGQIQSHVYWNSKFYQGFRDGQRSKQVDDLQDTLGWLGTAPVLGEPIDLINAGLSAIRGNYLEAGLGLAATVPVFGISATGAKFGLKNADNVASTAFKEISGTAKAVGEAVPNSVYNYTAKDGTLVSKYFYNDVGKIEFQIDFQNHGKWLPGHGHSMTIPGSLSSGHNGDHIPFMLVPKKYW